MPNLEKASTGNAHFYRQHIICSYKGPWIAESAALVCTSTVQNWVSCSYTAFWDNSRARQVFITGRRFEQRLIRECVVACMKEAKRRGRHWGQPTKQLDVEKAAELC